MAVDCGRNTEDCHRTIEVRNTATTTHYAMGLTEQLHSHLQTASPFLSPEAHAVESGRTSAGPLLRTSCWEALLSGNTLYVYSFHDSLASYEWETIVNQQLYEGPDAYTLNDLRAGGFKVTVP
ncbi:MAG: hypothetical protein IPJ76_05125 [Flavobacteriales bacterium]|nr:MAG: hypothetical protein IPJ76_05125 [Flavobacteriales bacterium]